MSKFKAGDLALTLVQGMVLPAMSQVEIVCPMEEGRVYSAIDDTTFTVSAHFWKVCRGGRDLCLSRGVPHATPRRLPARAAEGEGGNRMIWVIALVLAFSGQPGLAIYACLIAYILGD